MKYFIVVLLFIGGGVHSLFAAKMPRNIANAKLQMVETQVYKADERFGELYQGLLLTSDIATYDYNQLLLTRELKGPDGQIKKKWVYVYDDNKLLVSEKLLDEWGGVLEMWKYTYSDNKLLLEEQSYDKFGTLYKKWKYKYNLIGSKTETAIYNKDGRLEDRWIFVYDASGSRLVNVVQKKVTDGLDFLTSMAVEVGKDSANFTEFMDAPIEGEITDSVIIDKAKTGTSPSTAEKPKSQKTEKESRIEYKYDPYNNWVEATEFVVDDYGNEKAITITVRQIIYWVGKDNSSSSGSSGFGGV